VRWEVEQFRFGSQPLADSRRIRTPRLMANYAKWRGRIMWTRQAAVVGFGDALAVMPARSVGAGNLRGKLIPHGPRKDGSRHKRKTLHGKAQRKPLADISAASPWDIPLGHT